MTAKTTAEMVGKGVDALISRLRDEGVEAGRKQADALVESAREEAVALTTAAQRDADAILAAARAEASRLQAAARTATLTAARDVIDDLRDALTQRLSENFCKSVGEAVAEPETVKAMLLAFAAGAGAASGLAPDEDLSVVEPHAGPAVQRASAPARLVLHGVGEALRQGVVLKDGGEGFIIVMRNGALEADFAAPTLAKLILERLEPQFRALFEGELL